MNEPEKNPGEKSPSVLPPGFLKIIALPIAFPSSFLRELLPTSDAVSLPARDVISSLIFFAVCFLLLPRVIPILIFSGIAQFLLLLSSDNQDERVAGGAGIMVLIIFCVMLSEGFLSL